MPEPVEVIFNGIPAVKRPLLIRVDGEWIEKWEYGYPNNIREGEVQDDEPLKSAASDALKRCAWMWGIGRELRRGPLLWWPIDQFGRFVEPQRLSEEYDRLAMGEAGLEESLLESLTPTPTAPEEATMGFCPVHKIPFVHKAGARRDGSTYDFWGCPRKNADGSWCRERPVQAAARQDTELPVVDVDADREAPDLPGLGAEDLEEVDATIEAHLLHLGATTKAKQNSRYGKWAHHAGVTPMTATWRDLPPQHKLQFREWLEEQAA